MFVVGTLIRFTRELKTYYPSDFKYVRLSSVENVGEIRREREIANERDECTAHNAMH